jgi:zinc protease
MKNLGGLLTWIGCICFLAYITFNAINTDNKIEKKEYNYNVIENDPLNTLIYTLENGLKVYMSINKDEPRIQTNIAVKTGSKQDPSDATGLAHYLEHMLFKGTSEIGTINWKKEKIELDKISHLYEKRRNTESDIKRDAIYHKIDSISSVAASYAVANEYDKMISSLGAKGTNAYTFLEETVYVNDIPSNELEKWLAIESERFSELVLRLFHTELETVYEEFNRAQDNDWRLSWYTMMKHLFKKHPYGTQTTIGTSDDLKNPSMEKIHEYFNQYYVPNNMAIVLAGDIDPDYTIGLIERYFGSYTKKEIPEFISPIEDLITNPEIIDVVGSDSEWVDLGFRLDGVDSDDIYLLPLLKELLFNGKAGLIDLNLVKSQKILSGSADYMISKDYSYFILDGEPRAGQTLEEVRQLLLSQLDKIKSGEFEDWMMAAVIKNNKLNDQIRNEYNYYRVSKMTNAFILDQDWKDVVNINNKLSKVTKQDVVNFAQKYFVDNYVVVNKLNGTPNSIKVKKPAITNVPLNRDTTSSFAMKFNDMESKRLEPVFNDYQQDIKSFSFNNNIPGYYVRNTTNEVFSLSYIFEMGKFSDKELSLAIQYLEYLGTDEYTAEEIEKELFKLGLNYNVYVANERVYVSLSGLEESFEKGLEMFEHILRNVQADQMAYDNMIKDILRKRSDNKKSKWRIQSAMRDYAKYGNDSPSKHILSKKELKKVDVQKLVNKIKTLSSFDHYIYYYGRKNIIDIQNLLKKHHFVAEDLRPVIPAKQFVELDDEENIVYFSNYDMVQSEISMISKGPKYSKELIAPARLFNEYFGSGLSSIVFQEIRESKALAYSARSYFSTPKQLDKSHYVTAYLGTQVDKLNEATLALLELMNNMPESEGQFNDAKTAALKKIETSRTKRSSIFWRYLDAKKIGIDYDINKDIYQEINMLTLNDLKLFFNQNIKDKNYTFLVVGNNDLVDKKALKQIGVYEELTLEQLFGY